MRTETLEKRYCGFKELNEDQKTQALDRNRDWNVYQDWHEHIFEDATSLGELMGVSISKIYFSGFHSQGDGACFEGRFSFQKGIVQAVKNYAPLDKELHRIALHISTLHRKAFYSASGSVRRLGRYYHERSMDVEVDWEKGSSNYKDWEDVFADFALWIYKQLEKEHEYLCSDEAVSESLVANEVEFEIDENGDLAC